MRARESRGVWLAFVLFAACGRSAAPIAVAAPPAAVAPAASSCASASSASSVDGTAHPAPRDEDVDGPDVRLNRLVHVGKLWAAIRWFHPYIFSREIDWDGALVAALPKVSAAKSTEDYVAAVSEMLGALGDPLTHVLEKGDEKRLEDDSLLDALDGAHEVSPPVFAEREGGLVVVIAPQRYLAEKDKHALRASLRKAERVVFDLRAHGVMDAGPARQMLEEVASSLVSRPTHGRTWRYVQHQGFPDQNGPRRLYATTFVETATDTYLPEPGSVPKRVAFLVNANSALATMMFALQGSGDAVIVAEGPISEEAMPNNRTAYPLGEDRHVAVRTMELATGDPLRADIELPAKPRAGADRAMKAALGWLAKPRRARHAGQRAASEAMLRRDRGYDEMSYPPVEYRLLALFRAWSAIAWFFPYRHLQDRSWEPALREFIPAIESAADALQYGKVIAELAVRVQDGHAGVAGNRALDEWMGDAGPPIVVRSIEGEPVVTAVLGGTSTASCVRVGDVIAEVDGEPAKSRLERYGKYIGSSNAAGHGRTKAKLFLGGARGSKVVLALRDASERSKRCELQRDGNVWRNEPRKGDVVKELGQGIGYVDLSRLERGDVDAMFEKLRATHAIIFDMRGYPNGTAWSIAPRLDTRRTAVRATYFVPLVSFMSLRDGVASAAMRDEAPPDDGRWKYAGRTVMLIDESTISQSEHTGLFFEAVAGTKFIGSHTAGANGDVTSALLPGGMRFTFSGLDVRHADGRQLQRIGLIPDVPVAPTLAGIRAGQDEVLERAIQYLAAP
jgi:C-terminal processing protease CtpA/Prc